MNKVSLILLIFFFCSSCMNEENILPVKDKLSNKNSSGTKNDRTNDEDKNSQDDDDNEEDDKKDKEKDKEDKDKDKDKKDKKNKDDDDDDDDKKEKDKNKNDGDKKDKKDDDKDEKKDKKEKNKSGSTFLSECDQTKSLSDADVRAAFINRTWTAMLKNNAGQYEAYRLITTHNNITTSFANFSDCNTEINSYTAFIINHSWSGRTVNTGNADDSFRIGCMNSSYFEAIYPNGKILHFYDEDIIHSKNIDRCMLKFTVLN